MAEYVWGQEFGQGPVVANGVVYFTDFTQSTVTNFTTTIRAYNTKTGRPLWHSKPIGQAVWGISIADGHLWAIIGTDLRH